MASVESGVATGGMRIHGPQKSRRRSMKYVFFIVDMVFGLYFTRPDPLAVSSA